MSKNSRKNSRSDDFQTRKSSLWAGVALSNYGNRQGAMRDKKRYNRNAEKRELRQTAGY